MAISVLTAELGIHQCQNQKAEHYVGEVTQTKPYNEELIEDDSRFYR